MHPETKAHMLNLLDHANDDVPTETMLERLTTQEHPECDLNGHSWTPSGMRSVCSVCGIINKL